MTDRRRYRVLVDYDAEGSMVFQRIGGIRFARTSPERRTKETIRFMRLFSMIRKVMADMIEEEDEFGLDTPAQQERYVDTHQQWNDQWWPCFRTMDIGDYTALEMLRQLLYEATLVIRKPEFPGKDAIIPSQLRLHARVQQQRRAKHRSTHK